MSSSVARDSAVLAFGRGISFLIAAITPFFLVRIFNLGEYGEYREIMLIISTVSAILPLGMSQSLVYFFPHYPEDKKVYLARTLLSLALVGGVGVLVLMVGRPLLTPYVTSPRLFHNMHWILISAVLLTLSLVVETVLVAEKQIVLLGKVLIVSRLARGVVIVGLSLTGNVIYVLYGLIAWWALKLVLSLWYFQAKFRLLPIRLHLSRAGGQLNYAMPIALCGMFYELTQVADKYLISFYLGAEQFAIYSVGCYEIPLLVIVFQSIADVLLPRAVEMKRTGDLDGVIRTWHSGAELSFMFAWPMFAFAFFFADDIIPVLFTSTYTAAVPVFRITMINILIAATRYGLITRVFAKTWFDFAATLGSFAVMLPFCILGVQRYGLVGAAWALILGKVLNATAQLVYANRLLKISCLHILPFRRVLAVGGISLALALVLDLMSSGWTGLLPVKLVVLAVAYLALFCLATNSLSYWTVEKVPLPSFMRSKLLWVFK